MSEDMGCAGRSRVTTWRDGVLLTAEQKAALTPEQLSQYLNDSDVRDVAEIEDMPEPMRPRVRQMVESARARAGADRRRGGSPDLMRRGVRTTSQFWSALDAAMPSGRRPPWHDVAAVDLPEIVERFAIGWWDALPPLIPGRDHSSCDVEHQGTAGAAGYLRPDRLAPCPRRGP
jgi:hypothetical protein